MVKNFWTAVNGVIKESDVVLEIIDARRIDETRNLEIEDKVRKEGKILIFVFNKCDLADVKALESKKKQFHPCVFVSAKEYHGINLLYEKIMIEAHKLGIQKPRVGVVGYPNMGKSSLINAINGAGSARTSAESGFTKGKQYISAKKILLIDTPGVIPYGEKDDLKNALSGINTKLKDPETQLLRIMEQYEGAVEKYYAVECNPEDLEENLDNIAIKLNLLKKGAIPDSKKTSVRVLRDIFDGKIKF